MIHVTPRPDKSLPNPRNRPHTMISLHPLMSCCLLSGLLLLSCCAQDEPYSTPLPVTNTRPDDMMAMQPDEDHVDMGEAFESMRHTRFFKASNTRHSIVFGNAMSMSGDTFVVAASREDSDGIDPTNYLAQDSGAVYVFERDPGTGAWSEQAFLKPSRIGDGYLFGTSVSIQGDTLVVGASGEDLNTEDVHTTIQSGGAVYVFERDPKTGVWTEKDYLTAFNAGHSDYFGWSVSLSGDTLAIGAYGENSDGVDPDNDFYNQSGAVYVFEREPETGAWEYQAFLKGDSLDDDEFGYKVALEDDTLVISAHREDSDGTDPTNHLAEDSGAVYVFERDPRTGEWHKQAFLKASDVQKDDAFGCALSLSGDTLAIGAWNAGQDYRSGKTYLFERDPGIGVWSQQAVLTASNAKVGDAFGASLSLSGETLVVGAFGESSDGKDAREIDPAYEDSGAAYVFERDPLTHAWTQRAFFKASNADYRYSFGWSVITSGNICLVSSPHEASDGIDSRHSDESRSGAVYMFEL